MREFYAWYYHIGGDDLHQYIFLLPLRDKSGRYFGFFFETYGDLLGIKEIHRSKTEIFTDGLAHIKQMSGHKSLRYKSVIDHLKYLIDKDGHVRHAITRVLSL